MKYVPKWFPGAGFQSAAEYGAKLSKDMRDLPFYAAREKTVIRDIYSMSRKILMSYCFE